VQVASFEMLKPTSVGTMPPQFPEMLFERIVLFDDQSEALKTPAPVSAKLFAMVELVILRLEPALKMAPPAPPIRTGPAQTAVATQAIGDSALLFQKVLLTMLIKPLSP